MARISQYQVDTNISDNDQLLGSDAENANITKRFTVGDLAAYINGESSGAPGSGTVTSVTGTGTVSGITLSGTVTSTGSLTLGGSLVLTSGQITTGLGFTPYNATNPDGFTSFVEPATPLLTATFVVALTLLAVQTVLHPMWCLGGEWLARRLVGSRHERTLMVTLAALTVASIIYVLILGGR